MGAKLHVFGGSQDWGYAPGVEAINGNSCVVGGQAEVTLAAGEPYTPLAPYRAPSSGSSNGSSTYSRFQSARVASSSSAKAAPMG